MDVSRADAGATGRQTETVPVCLVRHAKARSRKRWAGPDDQRPLTRAGLERAAALVRIFAGRPLARLVSSPYVRCMQTLEPLAKERGLPLESSDSLAEGAPPEAALSLAVESARLGPSALCTHGDVVELLLEALDRHDVPLQKQDGIELRKGSTWVLDVLDRDVVAAEYLPPPEAGNAR